MAGVPPLKERVKAWVGLSFHGKKVPEKCSNCPKTVDTYCVECQKTYCRFCTVLLHHPHTKNETHSIEEIVQKRSGAKILSPILLDLLLVGAFLFLVTGEGIKEDYFKGGSYCPGVARGRWWITWFDANLFYLYKDKMARCCDWEDSYWRFFMDTWVRGVVTNTDSWVLLMSEFWYAFLFEEFIRFIVAPFIGFGYAALAHSVRMLEILLLSFLQNRAGGEESPVALWLHSIENFVAKLSFCETARIVDKKKPPPATLRRKRHSTDTYELGTYMWNRAFRLFRHYRAQAHAACNWVMRWSLIAAFFLRVLCMLCGGCTFAFIARLIGFGGVMDRHQTWFTLHTGVQPNQSIVYPSDRLAALGVHKAVGYLPTVLVTGGSTTLSLLAQLPLALSLAMRLWPALTIGMLYLAVKYILLPRQQKHFKAEWQTAGRKEIWGEMTRDAPCVGWAEIRFSDEN